MSTFADVYVQSGPFWGWSFERMAIVFVIMLGIIAACYIGARAMEINIPKWFIHLVGIVVIVFVVVCAIKLMANML